MHFSSAFATTIAVLPLAANAWNYSINNAPIHNGEKDVPCTAQPDGNCATEVGLSSKNWETTLTRDVAAFSITDC
ncbi:hypothetical protein ASPVEDRAFT_86658 [Aspergillus versicolor CBS 583.65]|uniref:Uncharacterized protein n=1 Tax=Aspergillus versicolor CBS 583.65 TaxID=1036611 RepID=A0A1L9PV09_ASPVE|nr:uncharacterized protein ASPVEDRAFT_86658 [Aspergillus versicolor CBS 583.65]OJJ05303.1 hypothetical protein ASPVEDRAFT_86658 [Aspergillus versicolor CBS 583.65]